MGLARTGCPPVIPDAQRAVIDAALRRFEKLKPAYAQLKQANLAWQVAYRKDSLLLADSGRIIDWYKVAYREEQGLRQDANKKLAISQGKAKRRGLLVAIETTALALVGYALIKK